LTYVMTYIFYGVSSLWFFMIPLRWQATRGAAEVSSSEAE